MIKSSDKVRELVSQFNNLEKQVKFLEERVDKLEKSKTP